MMESEAVLIRVRSDKQFHTVRQSVEWDAGLDSSRTFLQQEESIVRKSNLAST